MNVATLELCKELYELSGWLEADAWYWVNPDNDQDFTTSRLRHGKLLNIPAYDLGYLTRVMLPFTLMCRADRTFDAYWISEEEIRARGSSESSPENAVVRLAIELFEQGVLKKEKK